MGCTIQYNKLDLESERYNSYNSPPPPPPPPPPLPALSELLKYTYQYMDKQ